MKRYFETQYTCLQKLREQYLPLETEDLTTATEYADDLLIGKFPNNWQELSDKEQLSALIIAFITWIERISMWISFHGFDYGINIPDPFIDIALQCDPGLVWLALRNAKGGKEKPSGSISSDDFVKFGGRRPKIVELCIKIAKYAQI